MKSFKSYISEGIRVQYVRDKDMGVLKMWDTKKKGWVELRGKPNFETKYDDKDPLHQAITSLGKAANISDFVNGEVIDINPNHPDAKKAIKVIKGLMR